MSQWVFICLIYIILGSQTQKVVNECIPHPNQAKYIESTQSVLTSIYSSCNNNAKSTYQLCIWQRTE